MGALRVVDSTKWENAVRKAMRHAKGRVDEAAAELGVAKRTLFLWLEDTRFANIERAPTGIRRK